MNKRILVIKLTSMGDLMHALPALSDAASIFPDMEFDWVVDESFAEVPSWHKAVKNIFPSAHRRWKRNFLSSLFRGDFSRFYRDINAGDYDIVIDAQNNLKSAFVSFLRKGHIHGMDKNSVAESPAHLAIHHQHAIDKSMHAIERQRLLFSKALGYEVPDTPADYGLKDDAFTLPDTPLPERFLFLVHNASWTTKLWPEEHWHQLIELAEEAGLSVLLPSGNREELVRARRLAETHDNAEALPGMSLSELGGVIQAAKGAVCCDTGLAHLTAMIGTPAVSLYGPTSVELIGTTGRNQELLVASPSPFSCAPCYQRSCDFESSRKSLSSCMKAFSAEQVWQSLSALMKT